MEDVVDPRIEIEKKCHSSCTKQWKQYEACVERIAKKGDGQCEPWAMDYWSCLDRCVAPKLFAKLK